MIGQTVPKALLAYNTSVHESTGFTPYYLMFGREAILPLDVALKLETSVFPGSVKTYPEYVVQQKLQVEVTEQLVRENLKRAQKSQKAYYDTKCYGQQFHAGDRVWYRNRTRVRRKKFLKPWCGPWKVIKALSGVTYRIEEEKRKPGRHRQRSGPLQLLETVSFSPSGDSYSFIARAQWPGAENASKLWRR